MDEETRKALEDSIQKWKDIVEGGGVDRATKNCALCAKFSNQYNCDGCPVAETVNRDSCCGTPWIQWRMYFASHPYYKGELRVIDEKSRCLAKDELTFLESLRPEEAKIKRTN